MPQITSASLGPDTLPGLLFGIYIQNLPNRLCSLAMMLMRRLGFARSDGKGMPASSLAYAAPQTRHLRHIPSPQRKTSSPLSERVHSKTQHPPPRHDRPDEIRRPPNAAQTPHIQRPNSQLAAKSASRKPLQVAGSERPLAEGDSGWCCRCWRCCGDLLCA